MTPWATTTLILCLYGFLKELRPSEPFLTEYLIDTKWVNITLEEVNIGNVKTHQRANF
jgi:thiamine transporter 2/3